MKKFRELETRGQKTARIFLWISFVPAVLILLYGVYCAFAGFDFFSTSYGIEGFTSSIVIMLWVFGLIIPILPVCVIYQIIYLIWGKFKWKSLFKKKVFIWTTGVIISGLSFLAVWSLFGYDIRHNIDKIQAISFYNKAEDKVEYTKYHIETGNVMGIEGLHNSCVMFDEDTMSVGIVYAGDMETFTKAKLEKAESIYDMSYSLRDNNSYLQSAVKFDKVGCTLFTFYGSPSNTGRTAGCIVEMKDGSIWYSTTFRNFEDGEVQPYTALDGINEDFIEEALYGDFLERYDKT